jgi:3-oxoisoapionate decarboxylase
MGSGTPSAGNHVRSSGSLTRREMLRMLSAGAAGAVLSTPRVFAVSPRRKRLGIGMHSYGFQWRAAQDGAREAKFSDALEFVDYCHGLGAGGVQVTIKSRDPQYARQIRKKAEAYGMYFEGQLSLPKDEADCNRFEKDLTQANEAGATIVRTACLSGRRYETFHSADEFKRLIADSCRTNSEAPSNAPCGGES